MYIPIKDESDEVFTKQEFMLDSVALLKYFLGVDDHIADLIICKGTEYNLKTYDFNIYEALASLEKYDNFDLSKLRKLFEVVTVLPSDEKKVLTFNRKDYLRKKALESVREKLN